MIGTRRLRLRDRLRMTLSAAWTARRQAFGGCRRTGKASSARDGHAFEASAVRLAAATQASLGVDIRHDEEPAVRCVKKPITCGGEDLPSQ